MTDFLQSARARGLVIEHVNADGRIHRVPVDGKPKTDKTGWYVYHTGSERAYAVFGRWDDGLPDETWMERSDTPPTTAEKKQMQETRQAIRKESEAGYSKAAAEARRLFDKAADADGTHAYLQKKRVKPFGVKNEGASLLIPLRDAEDVLWSLQRILPNGEKRFHPGGRTSGCFHWLGDPAGAAWLLLAEGYATAATIHEATGLPVVAAMNCGNLLPVAEALAAKYPDARFLVCADDDRNTEVKIGRNPGIDAARAVLAKLNKGQPKGGKRARYVVPEVPEGYGSDFNDLAVVAGMDAVRRQIEAAIGKTSRSGTLSRSHGKLALVPKGKGSGSKPASNGSGGSGNGGNGGGSEPPSSDRPHTRFTVDDDGVWHHGIDKNGEPLPPFWVCSPLHVVAHTRDTEAQGWGYLLELPDREDNMHPWAMPARMLAGDGNEYRSNLLDMGLVIAPGAVAKNLLTQYLQTAKPEAYARCADTIGWHGRSFVLPDRSIGNNEERFIFQSAASSPNAFKQKGSAEDWKEQIGKHCAGNSRLVFAASVAFAGPLLKVAGLESGGFHFRGASSVGKTCALRVAASVYGGEDFLRRWRLTDNAMEGMAAQHSDTVLVLDEIGMADPKTIGESAYMLANETGKGRMARTGAPRPSLTWRLLFLSSGEKSLADHMGEANKRSNAGQEVRICDLPADAGAGLGLFENLGDFADAKVFHRWFMDKTREYHGAVGIAWLERLAVDLDTLPGRLRELRDRFMDGLVPDGASGQVYRGANRFALVAAAGEIASSYGLTGWQAGKAITSAKTCFTAWLDARGGIETTEEMQMLAQVRRFIEQNDNRFEWWDRTMDNRAPIPSVRCGFKRPLRDGKIYEGSYKDGTAQPEDLTTAYYVLPESFKSEICKGFDVKAMCRLLRDENILDGEKDGFTRSERLPGIGKSRCYRINSETLGIGNKEKAETGDARIEVTL